MSKRKYDEIFSNEKIWSTSTSTEFTNIEMKKNSLDSDEEDDNVHEETYNVMDEDDFEGMEDGPMSKETTIGFTAFNIKEELEEGTFDKDGHYVWKKEKKIRDNWLDNIDWIQIGNTGTAQAKNNDGDNIDDNDEIEVDKGLASDGSDSEGDTNTNFNPIHLYKQIIEYMLPGETVSKALCRFGKSQKRISSAERLKRKKAGLDNTNDNSEKIIQLTELANQLLTKTGNMDIYQETYEFIKQKIDASTNVLKAKSAQLDMYSDDFDTKEKEKLSQSNKNPSEVLSNDGNADDTNISAEATVKWEIKWSRNDDAEINGPYTTEQMFKWAKEGNFKNGAWVRRVGRSEEFYNVARIDFELYL